MPAGLLVSATKPVVVNGVWELRAVDTLRGSVGTIQDFGLELTSRWD